MMFRRVAGLVVFVVFLVLGVGAASAQLDPYVEVLPDEIEREELPPPATPEAGPDVIAQPEVRGTQAQRGLPVTGGDVLGLAAIGGALVAVGAIAVVSTRRRRTGELGG